MVLRRLVLIAVLLLSSHAIAADPPSEEPEDPMAPDLVQAEQDLQTSHTPTDRVRLAFLLHAFAPDTPERTAKIVALLETVRDELRRQPDNDDGVHPDAFDRVPLYDGTGASLSAFAWQFASSYPTDPAMVPCQALLHDSSLRPAVAPTPIVLWPEDERQNVPLSDCSSTDSSFSRFPKSAVESYRHRLEHMNGDWHTDRSFASVAARFSVPAEAVVDDLTVQPWVLLPRAAEPGKELRPWSYLSAWNAVEYKRYLDDRAEAIAALIGYFEGPPHRLYAAEARAAAEAGLAALTPGCDSGFDGDTLRTLVVDGAAPDRLQAYIDSGRWTTDRATESALDVCAQFAGREPLLHMAVLNPPSLDVLWRFRQTHPDEPLAAELAIDVPNEFGKTPLMTAAQQSSLPALAFLLQHGANVNAQTDLLPSDSSYELIWQRRTALMYAAEAASPDVIEALLAAGADICLQDNRGNTAYRYLLGTRATERPTYFGEPDPTPRTPNPNVPDETRKQLARRLNCRR